MAASGADGGFGTTITFQSGFFATITNVGWSGFGRETIDTTHMGSTNGYKTFLPSDLKDLGELSVDLLFNKSLAALKTAMTATAETITVTFPVSAGGTTAASIACAGFLTGFEVDDPMEGEAMSATATLKFTGEPTMTDQS